MPLVVSAAMPLTFFCDADIHIVVVVPVLTLS